MPAAKAKGPADLSGIITRINRQHGPGTIVTGVRAEPIQRITSGSLGLDMALGGGWAVNHWHEIVGEFSSGKTALILQTVAANQARDPNWRVWWLASEDFNEDYATMAGVDLGRVHRHETNVTQDGLSAVLDVAATREVDCIVIDSLPALVPDEEDEGDMGDWSVGLAARLNNQFFRKQGPATRRSLVDADRPMTCFVINQYREKIGVMRGDPRVTPGGRQKDYEYWTKVEVKRDDLINDSHDDPIGQVIKVTVRKNKSAPPLRTAVFDFYFAPGGPVPPGRIDSVREVVDLAVTFDVVRQGGGGMYYFGERSWKGKPAVAEALRGDADFRAHVSRQLLALTSGQGPTTAEDPPESAPPPAKKVRAVKKAVKRA